MLNSLFYSLIRQPRIIGYESIYDSNCFLVVNKKQARLFFMISLLPDDGVIIISFTGTACRVPDRDTGMTWLRFQSAAEKWSENHRDLVETYVLRFAA